MNLVLICFVKHDLCSANILSVTALFSGAMAKTAAVRVVNIVTVAQAQKSWYRGGNMVTPTLLLMLNEAYQGFLQITLCS